MTDRVTDIIVYGATGLTGRRVCTELEAAGTSFAIAGRSAHKLAMLARELPAATTRVMTTDDLDFSDAKLVLNCAGPAGAVNEPILAAALAAGAHYLDLGGEQAWLHGAYERHESTGTEKRGASRSSAPASIACSAIGPPRGPRPTSAATSTIRRRDPDRADRSPRRRPTARRDFGFSYVFDKFVLSPAGQHAAFARLHERALVWRRDRWESIAPASERRTINAGLEMGGEREVVAFPGGDVITIPRHVDAMKVQTFASTSRNRATTTALRLIARAVPFVPKRVTDALGTYEPREDEYARTRFAVIAQARRGFSAAQVTVRGTDMYTTSAIIAAWIARQLVARTTGPVGMRAPSELFRPVPALREVAEAAGLVVEPSFA